MLLLHRQHGEVPSASASDFRFCPVIGSQGYPGRASDRSFCRFARAGCEVMSVEGGE
jgi:hypothetical protein